MVAFRIIGVLLILTLWVQPALALSDPPPAPSSPTEDAAEKPDQEVIWNPRNEPESPEPAEKSPKTRTAKPLVKVETTPVKKDAVSILMREMGLMLEEIQALRKELAATRLQGQDMRRELDELRLFMEDHHEYGDDFEQYQAIKSIREAESKQRLVVEAQKRRAAEKDERIAKRKAFQAARAAEQASKNAAKRYTKGGFSPLGLEVYGSKMAYAYQPVDSTQRPVDYGYPFVDFLQLYPSTDIDYAHMTISGSVLNAADALRNLGVAITFFDEYGNQVGHEIVQVKNARPDVPYPFTSTIDMALDRPFSSTSIYVLYADEVAEE